MTVSVGEVVAQLIAVDTRLAAAVVTIGRAQVDADRGHARYKEAGQGGGRSEIQQAIAEARTASEKSAKVARLIDDARRHLANYVNVIAPGAMPVDASRPNAMPDGERLVAETERRARKAELLGIATDASVALGGLYSRSGAVSNQEVIDGNLGLPRTQETIAHYAALAGADLSGVNVEIIESADDVAYLDFMQAVARTDADGVQLGPAAFIDEETLVRTLGHESIHVEQYRQGRVTSDVGPLEEEAYAAEEAFVETWRRNSR